jgi:hypothetical protein
MKICVIYTTRLSTLLIALLHLEEIIVRYILFSLAVLGLLTLAASALTPGLVTFAWYLFICLLPYLVVAALALAIYAISFEKTFDVLGNILAFFIFIGGIGGYFVFGDQLGEYEFAKSLNYEVIQTLPKTTPDSFRDMPESVAHQILGNNTTGSLYRYSTLVHSYNGGKDGFVTQQIPKKIAGKFGDQIFDVLQISKDQNLTKVGQTPYAIDGAWWDHDLMFVLQKKQPLKWLASTEVRYIVDPETKKWVLYVPTYEYQWNGILRVFTWSGGFFVDGGNINYLDKPQIHTSKYSKLNVAPPGYVRQVTNLYRYKLANSYWGVQFGTDQDYEPSKDRADHIMTDKGDLTAEFIEPEGVSNKIKDIVFVGGGQQILVYFPKDQYTPDIFRSKVEAIIAKNPGSIVNQTSGKYPVTAIAGWHVGDFLPVLRNGDVWYVYFVNSSADASIRRGLIAVNSSNQVVASGQEIDSYDTNQFVYFNSVDEVEAWIGGKDAVVNTTQTTKDAKSTQSSSITTDRLKELEKVQAEILKNQQEILRILKSKN